MKASKIFWLSLLVCGVICLIVLDPQLALGIYLFLSAIHFIHIIMSDEDREFHWIEFIFIASWIGLILLGIGYIFGFIVDGVLYFNRWLDEKFENKNKE